MLCAEVATVSLCQIVEYWHAAYDDSGTQHAAAREGTVLIGESTQYLVRRSYPGLKCENVELTNG